MSEDPPTAKVKPSDEPSGPEEDELSGPKEIVLSPPSGPPIIEDTASPPGTDNYAPSESEFVGPSAGVRQVSERRSVKVHIGPLPDPETLKELAALYPEAPKVIFEDFHAQCSHRIEMEQLRMKTTSTLALRGQMIGGILGAIGLVGSLIVAGIGHGWAGFGIALTSLGSLVSIFVYGRDQQKRERIEKQAIREKIARGEPIDEIEGATPHRDSSATPNPSAEEKQNSQ